MKMANLKGLEQEVRGRSVKDAILKKTLGTWDIYEAELEVKAQW